MIEFAKDEIYVTYIKKTNKPFNRDKIMTIIGIPNPMNKPNSALWGSPIDAEFGWKEWCFLNGFKRDYNWKNPIKWKLRPYSKVLKIDFEDIINEQTSILRKYIADNKNIFGMDFDFPQIMFDFELMLKDGISAVQLMNSSIGHFYGNDLEIAFNTWDCESIVVLDETKIEFL